MKPINSHNFGTKGIKCSYYNGSAVVNGYITKQMATNKFKVTDGTTPKIVTLAQTTAIATSLNTNPTKFTISVRTPDLDASGAVFTANYAVDTVTVANGGTGYAAANVLTLANSGGATVTVATAPGGVIATVTVTTAGTGVTALGGTRTVSGGAGTGATFDIKWKLLSVTSSGGTGYDVGDTLVFNGVVATTKPLASITTATGGAATAVTVSNAGAGITTAATSVAVAAASDYVARIWDSKVRTVSGLTCKWGLGGSIDTYT
jgi:hypothetical protein